MERPPAAVGMRLEDVDTPALLIDLDAFDRNIERLAPVGTPLLALRPHAKTHKCPAVALRQIASGAIGVCCQKVGEAEVMAEGGVQDILVTNEIWGMSKLYRLAALAHHAHITVCADDESNVRDLSEVAEAYGVTLDVLVEINVGGRCGVEPGPAAVTLAQLIASAPGLRFAGLQAYDGSAQHLRTYVERKKAIDATTEKVRATKERIERSGLECRTISGGGTGTYELEASSGVFTELQAGSYIFMDADYAMNRSAAGEPYRDFEHSLFVYTTVMSRPTRASGIVDAGLKAYSVDSGPPRMFGDDEVVWAGGGDEHGKFTAESGTFPLALGDKVRLVPGHCDPTVNLYDWYVGVRNARVEAVWAILARGMGR